MKARFLERARARIDEASECLEGCRGAYLEDVVRAVEIMVECLQSGSAVYFCGNGGSAADAQHWAAELTGRFLRERRGFKAFALTVNPSVLTAVANDYGFEHVFVRQVEACFREGDVLVAISTSGCSSNVVRAARFARERGHRVIGVTGKEGGDLAGTCDVLLCAPSVSTPRIQEVHLLTGHLLCELVEETLAGATSARQAGEDAV